MFSLFSKILGFAERDNGPKTFSFDGEMHKEDFYIAGIPYRMQEMKNLCIFNPDWRKSTKSLINPDHSVRLYKYTFVNKPVKLIPEPTNPHDPNAVKVVVAGEHIGYISSGDNIHVLEILKYAKIVYISCSLRGGERKTISPDGDVLKEDIGIYGNVRIGYIAKE